MLEGLTPPKRITTCRVRTLLAELDKKDSAILQDALDNTAEWTTNGLHTALHQRGINLTSDAINRHRTKVCSCSKI